jgi:hypothetical protein
MQKRERERLLTASFLTIIMIQGYNSDHPEIELLRLRNYTLGRSLADSEVLGKAGRARIAQLLTALEPFVSLQHLREGKERMSFGGAGSGSGLWLPPSFYSSSSLLARVLSDFSSGVRSAGYVSQFGGYAGWRRGGWR